MHVRLTTPGVATQVGRVAPAVPASSAAVPIGESALRNVLNAHSGDDPSATAVALLRQVEALLTATAPAGTSAEDIGAAASRLVERQGLLSRLGGPPAADWSSAQEQTRVVGDGSSAVDKKL